MKKKILLLDDEQDILRLLQRSLQFEGYHTAEAESGTEAKEILRSFTPDLIICDLQLADSDGLSVISEIKQSLPQVPVILLTGVAFDPAECDVTFGGLVTNYVPKPARLSQIAKTVASIIGPGSP